MLFSRLKKRLNRDRQRRDLAQPVFLIGAMKCGTNTIFHTLKNHPEVSIPRAKELDYFLRNADASASGFRDNFKINENTKVLLDGTTQYSKFPDRPHCAVKIHKVFPDAKIIYMMRDPIARAESQIAHHIARGENATLENWR